MEPNSEKVEKRERIACLYLTFLNHPGGLSFRQIKKYIPLAYSGEPESARRKFERDKEELKNLGMDVLHHPPGSVLPNGSVASDHRYIPASEIHYLPQMNFSSDEARILASCLYRTVMKLKNRDEDSSLLESASAKLFYNIPEALFIDEIFSPGYLDFSTEQNHGENFTLAAVSEAILNKKIIKFSYHSSSGKRDRTAEPRGLIAHRGRWCLVAVCRDTKAVRHFYLDRMEKLEQTDTTFPNDSEFQIQNHLLHPLLIRNHEEAEITAFYSDDFDDTVSDYLSEIPDSLILKRTEKSFQFKTTNRDAFFSWMLKHPGMIRSLEPEGIKAKYNKFVSEIREFYS
ncbi:MAG: WYL domain-containing protein [Spirochaetia bacterium]|nr:WYL domain-containing protein [Spirochaetia bacterium]